MARRFAPLLGDVLIVVVVAVVVVVFVVILTHAPAHAGQTYYVGAAGNDTNPGTADKPFATIQRARAWHSRAIR